MLQVVNTQNYPVWPGPPSNSKRWTTARGRKRESTLTSASETITRLYPKAVVASSESLAWRDICLVHMRHSLNKVEIPSSDHHCLVVNLGAPLQLSMDFEKRNLHGKVHAGEVAIIPAGTAWSYESRGPVIRNALLLFLRPLVVRSVVERSDFARKELAVSPQIGFRSTQIRHISMSLLGELNQTNVVGRFCADSMATSLALLVIRHYSSLKDANRGQGGMAPHKLRRAIAMIDSYLEQEAEGRVALRSVAKDVGISYCHFSRAFKQSMGMTPTSYIAERRIERAKRLMEETDLAISEIALRAGFCSQSQFTTSFRRLAGVTPSSFRKAM
jgi:AraC family transcriptional regulator